MKAEVERGGQGAGVGGGSIRRGEAAVGGGDDWGKWVLTGGCECDAPIIRWLWGAIKEESSVVHRWEAPTG